MPGAADRQPVLDGGYLKRYAAPRPGQNPPDVRWSPVPQPRTERVFSRPAAERLPGRVRHGGPRVYEIVAGYFPGSPAVDPRPAALGPVPEGSHEARSPGVDPSRSAAEDAGLPVLRERSRSTAPPGKRGVQTRARTKITAPGSLSHAREEPTNWLPTALFTCHRPCGAGAEVVAGPPTTRSRNGSARTESADQNTRTSARARPRCPWPGGSSGSVSSPRLRQPGISVGGCGPGSCPCSGSPTPPGAGSAKRRRPGSP